MPTMVNRSRTLFSTRPCVHGLDFLSDFTLEALSLRPLASVHQNLQRQRIQLGITHKFQTARMYAAPETLLGDVPSPIVDVWAFAVLMYYLVSGCLFLSHSNRAKLDEVLAEMVEGCRNVGG